MVEEGTIMPEEVERGETEKLRPVDVALERISTILSAAGYSLDEDKNKLKFTKCIGEGIYIHVTIFALGCTGKAYDAIIKVNDRRVGFNHDYNISQLLGRIHNAETIGQGHKTEETISDFNEIIFQLLDTYPELEETLPKGYGK